MSGGHGQLQPPIFHSHKGNYEHERDHRNADAEAQYAEAQAAKETKNATQQVSAEVAERAGDVFAVRQETKQNLTAYETQMLTQQHAQHIEQEQQDAETFAPVLEMAPVMTERLNAKIQAYARARGQHIEPGQEMDFLLQNEGDDAFVSALEGWLNEMENGPGVIQKGMAALSGLARQPHEMNRNLINAKDLAPLAMVSYALYAVAFRSIAEKADDFGGNMKWALRLGVLMPVVTGLSNKLFTGEEAPVASAVQAAGRGYFELLTAGFKGSQLLVQDVLHAENPSVAFDNMKQHGNDLMEWAGLRNAESGRVEHMAGRLGFYTELGLADTTVGGQAIKTQHLLDTLASGEYDTLTDEDMAGIIKLVATIEGNRDQLAPADMPAGGINKMDSRLRANARNGQMLLELAEVLQYEVGHNHKLMLRLLVLQGRSPHLLPQDWSPTRSTAPLMAMLRNEKDQPLVKKLKNDEVQALDTYNGVTPQIMRQGELGGGLNGVEMLGVGLVGISVATKVIMQTTSLISGEMFNNTDLKQGETDPDLMANALSFEGDWTKKGPVRTAYKKLQTATKNNQERRIKGLIKAAAAGDIITSKTAQQLKERLLGDGKPKEDLRQQLVDTTQTNKKQWQSLLQTKTKTDAGNAFFEIIKSTKSPTLNTVQESHSQQISLLSSYSGFRSSVLQHAQRNPLAPGDLPAKKITYQTTDGEQELILNSIERTFRTGKNMAEYLGDVTFLNKVTQPILDTFLKEGGLAFTAKDQFDKPQTVFMWVKNGTPRMRVSPSNMGLGKLLNTIKIGRGHEVKSIDATQQ